MDLRRLRLFLAVVDAGGFSAAARVVHVAQPAISLAVRELETEVGTPLLVRSRSGVVLTAAGEALVPPARQALRDVETAAAAVAAVTGLVGGRLDLAALPTLTADPLADLVGAFRRAHPAIQVRLGAPNDPAEVADAVRAGEVEVAVTEQGNVNDDIREHPLVVQELLLVSPPGARAGKRPLPLEALAGEPLVLSPTGTSLRAVVDAAARSAGFEPDVAVESSQRDALVPLVLAGAGVTFLPAALARSAEALGAVVRRTQPPLRRSVVLVHRRGPLSPAATAFLEIAGVATP